MSRNPRVDAAVFLALVALAILGRFIGAAPNFAAVAGVALFAGFFFASRLTAIAVPITAMLISDLFLGWYDPRQMVVVYVCLVLPVLFRGWIGHGERPHLARVLAASL